MDCKHCKQPTFIPSQIDKTWGYFEERHISCNECKTFCKKDKNCDGIVCYDWPAHAPEHHNLSSCLWMKKEIVGQCIDTGNDNYLTCLKKPQGNCLFILFNLLKCHLNSKSRHFLFVESN